MLKHTPSTLACQYKVSVPGFLIDVPVGPEVRSHPRNPEFSEAFQQHHLQILQQMPLFGTKLLNGCQWNKFIYFIECI